MYAALCNVPSVQILNIHWIHANTHWQSSVNFPNLAFYSQFSSPYANAINNNSLCVCILFHI
jgi:hypothetical protein